MHLFKIKRVSEKKRVLRKMKNSLKISEKQGKIINKQAEKFHRLIHRVSGD
jgi:hypothetical protein